MQQPLELYQQSTESTWLCCRYDSVIDRYDSVITCNQQSMCCRFEGVADCLVTCDQQSTINVFKVLHCVCFVLANNNKQQRVDKVVEASFATALEQGQAKLMHVL